MLQATDLCAARLPAARSRAAAPRWSSRVQRTRRQPAPQMLWCQLCGAASLPARARSPVSTCVPHVLKHPYSATGAAARGVEAAMAYLPRMQGSRVCVAGRPVLGIGCCTTALYVHSAILLVPSLHIYLGWLVDCCFTSLPTTAYHHGLNSHMPVRPLANLCTCECS